MASLIPDVGNVRPDTAGAGRLYQAAMEGFQRALNAPMERIEKLQAKQLEEDKYNTDLGFKTRAEERLINKEKEDKERVLATNNALATLLDPDKVTSLNTAAGDVTTQNQINMYNQANNDGIVTPQEQALIDARYKEDLSKDVLSNQFADQSVILSGKNSILDAKLKDPNSKEYQAAMEAEFNAAKRKADYSHGLTLAALKRQEERDNKVRDDYVNLNKNVLSLEDSRIIPAHTKDNVVLNQKDIAAFDNNLVSDADKYNAIYKGIVDKGEVKLDPTYKPNPGSSIKIIKDNERILKGQELEEYAHNQAYKQTFGNYDFSKTPKPVLGSINVGETKVKKPVEELMTERLNLIYNSGLPLAQIQALEKQVLGDAKSKKEAKELAKIDAQINKYNLESQRITKDIKSNPTTKVPNQVGEKTSELIGGSDAKSVLNQVNTIANGYNLPLAGLYDLVEQANNMTSTGAFSNVDEDMYKELLASLINQKYGTKISKELR